MHICTVISWADETDSKLHLWVVQLIIWLAILVECSLLIYDHVRLDNVYVCHDQRWQRRLAPQLDQTNYIKSRVSESMSVKSSQSPLTSGCLQIQLNTFTVDFKRTCRRHFKKLSVGFHVVAAWLIILRRQTTYELSLTEHVMMSSDQRSSLWHPTNLLGLH